MGVYTVTAGGLATARLVRQYFPEQWWLTMVAVADAESAFEPGQITPPYGTTGLWQINPQPNAWGPYLAKTYHVYGVAAQQAWLKDPQHNAEVAAHILATQGIGAWAQDGYRSFLGIAQTLLDRTAVQTQSVAAVVTAANFGVTGSAHVGSGGRIIGRLQLHATGGSIPYRVVMRVGPSYESSDPTQTVASGTAPANRTITVTQSLVAPLPAPNIIRAHQIQNPGPVSFPFDVSWVVTDTRTGQSRTVNGGQRVTLTIG